MDDFLKMIYREFFFTVYLYTSMRGHGIPLETQVVFYLSGVGKKVSTLTLMNNSISLCVCLVTVMKRVLLSLFSTSKVYGDLNHGEIKGTIQLFFLTSQ